MSDQVENPILTPCPPKRLKPPSLVIDLTSATQYNKKHKLTYVVWHDFKKKTIDGSIEYCGLFVIIAIANLRLQAGRSQHTCIIICKGVQRGIIVILEIYLIKRKFRWPR